MPRGPDTEVTLVYLSRWDEHGILVLGNPYACLLKISRYFSRDAKIASNKSRARRVSSRR